MKWKDRVLVLLCAIIILIVFKYFGPIRTNVSIDTDVIKRRVNDELRHVKLVNVEEDPHPQWLSMHAWDIWQGMVNEKSMTNVTEIYMNKILKEMAVAKLTKVDVGHKGTQLKATIFLDGPENQKAIFKPKRYTRDQIFKGIFEGIDRHNGEIAAFHLDRLLGMFRAPPVVGRFINIEKEVYPVVSSKLNKTFVKQKGNICLYGVCMTCKKTRLACADGKVMEGSVTLWLPPKYSLGYNRHPYQRTYRKNRMAKWEEKNICGSLVLTPPYNQGRRLLDILDSAVFDFLIGNADRHHYEFFQTPNSNEGIMLNLDNGKSFGNPDHDEMSILAPVTQCCRLRQSTYHRLNSFISSASLSSQLERRLKHDPIYPILTLPHLQAIDRRLTIVLRVLDACIKEKGYNKVILTRY